MNKRNVIITIISVLILTCLFAYARTTTTDLGLVQPTWTETVDILNDINANSDILEAFANDPLKFDSDLERLEDRAGAMWTGNTETGLTITYQDVDNTIDAVIGANDIVESMLKAVNAPLDEEIFTYESTTGDFEWHTLAELSIQPLDATLTAVAGLTITANSLIYGTGTDAFAILATNATATNKFLREVSSGAPAWATLVAGDIPDISATYQPLDTALTNISALVYVSPSFIKLTADDTYAARTPAETLSDIGAQASDASLTSIAGLTYASPSFIKVTAEDTYAIRTITETKTDLSLNNVTNDAQIAKSIGTAQGDLIYFTGSATPTVLAKGTATQVLAMNAGATAPEWAAAAGGYTNLTSFVDQTAWRVFYSNTAGDVTELALGADGTYLKSNGAAAAPTFATPAGSGTVTTSGSPIDNDFAKFTAPTVVEGRSYSETRTDLGLVIGTNVAACGANTDITSILNAALYVGRDADNQIKFSTDNKIIFRVNAADKAEMISTGELDMNAGSVGFTQQSTTGDGTTTIDWKLGNKFKFTFGAQNDTFMFTAPTNPCNILLVLIQDGTGGRLATWPGTVKWAGGTAPTLTTTAAGVDICSFYWDGTNYFGVASLAFATP